MSRRVFLQPMKEVAGIVYNIAVGYYARSGNTKRYDALCEAHEL